MILNLFGLSARAFDPEPQSRIFQPPLQPIKPFKNGSQPEPWVQVSTRHLIFILPKSHTQTARYLHVHQDQFDRIYENIKKFFPDMPEPVPIFLEHRATVHNGSASALPSPRITAYLVPPDFSTDLGESKNYLIETARHELAHIAHFSAKSGFYKFLSTIFGDVVNPAGVTPRWFLEGFAVWAETAASSVGRGRSTFEQGWVELLAPHWPALADMTGPRLAYPRGNTHYLYGYLFFEYLAKTHGHQKLLDYAESSGHVVPSFYDIPAKTIFDPTYSCPKQPPKRYGLTSHRLNRKPPCPTVLSILWEKARQYFLKQIRSESETQKFHAITPITPEAPVAYSRGTPAVVGSSAYYWEGHPYEGTRLIRQELRPPYTATRLERLTPSQALNPTLTHCLGALYGTAHTPSEVGPTAHLVRWTLPHHQFEELDVDFTPYGKVVDMACARYRNRPAVVLLLFWDLNYNLVAFQDNRLYPIGQLPYNPNGVFPIQLIDHPKHIHLLMRNVITHATEVWSLSSPPQKTQLPWTGHRHLYRLTYDPATQGFWGIIDGFHGRSVIKLDSQFQISGEIDLASPLPIEIFPINNQQLLLYHITWTGPSFAVTSSPQTLETFDTDKPITLPHNDPNPLPLLRDEPNAIQTAPPTPSPKRSPAASSSVEPYNLSTYLWPHYWYPSLTASSIPNPTFGIVTSAQDPTETLGYKIQAQVEVNPFAIGVSNLWQWHTFLITHGPLVGLNHIPSGIGSELIQTQFTTGWLWSQVVGNGSMVFVSALYTPGYNLSRNWRHFFALPIVFQHLHTWGEALYHYGWGVSAEVEVIGGTVFNLGGSRLFNGDIANPNISREWHGDIKPSVLVRGALPLFSSTTGLHQSLLYVYHNWTSGSLGPVDFDLFRPKTPVPTLVSSTSTPFNLSVTSDSHHIIIHKFRPFMLLVQADIGFLFFPLFIQDIWLEGIFDTGYFDAPSPWLGSFGAQLTANLSIFFHKTTSVKIALHFPWLGQISTDNVNFGGAFEIPFPL